MPLRLPRSPHRWNVSPAEAIAVQRELASRIRQTPNAGPFRWIAGVDAAFIDDGRTCLAAVVLWDRDNRTVVEQHLASDVVRFPYIPGLLSFREVPAVLLALRRLSRRPDLLLCDGQGRAHPRCFGLACHLGLVTRWPAVGCAKSRLVGTHDPPGTEPGSRVPLRVDDELVGQVLRTRSRSRPVFVSVGHGLDLPTAVQVVWDCLEGHRLPEPTWLADRLVSGRAREIRRATPEHRRPAEGLPG